MLVLRCRLIQNNTPGDGGDVFLKPTCPPGMLKTTAEEEKKPKFMLVNVFWPDMPPLGLNDNSVPHTIVQMRNGDWEFLKRHHK